MRGIENMTFHAWRINLLLFMECSMRVSFHV